jgi:hypothetical protein
MRELLQVVKVQTPIEQRSQKCSYGHVQNSRMMDPATWKEGMKEEDRLKNTKAGKTNLK